MTHRYAISIVTASLLYATLYAQPTVDLGDIDVTVAPEVTDKLAQTASDVTVITAEDIQSRGYTSLPQALNAQAGMSIVSNGGPGQPAMLYLRGMSSKYTLVLLDGIRLNDPTGLNGAPYADLSLDDVERIEIIKGAQSGLWGADAAAGVIHIITKKAAQGTHASAFVEGGSFGTFNYGATLSYGSQNFEAKVSYNLRDTDGFSAVAPYGTDIDTLEDDEYKNQTLNAKAAWHIDPSNTLRLQYHRIEGKGDADPYDATTYSFNPNGNYRFESTVNLYKVAFDHTDAFETLHVYAQRSDFSRTYPDDSFSQHFDGQIDEYGINSRINYRTNDRVVIGVDYRKFTHKNDLDRSYRATGIYATNTNTFDGFLGGKTILSETLRYDAYNAFKNKTTWQVGLKHMHERIKGLTTSFHYGTAYNVPTIYNLYDPFSGNADLTPETVKSFDVSIAYQGLQLTYFHNRIEDMINYVSRFDASGNWIGGGFDNIDGTSKIDGLELSYRTQLGNDWLMGANYTHLFKAEDTNGKALGRRAKDTANLTVDYYGITRTHIGAQLQYVGTRYDFDDRQGRQTGRYTLLNLTADYRIADNITLYGRVENVGDKYYQTVDGYATSPRAYYVGIRGSF